MAAAGRRESDADYQEHVRTFDGFMQVTIWSTTLVAMSVLFLTLVFVVGTPWLGALVIGVAVGFLTGLALNRGGAWYGAMIALFVAGLIGGGVFELIRTLVG